MWCVHVVESELTAVVVNNAAAQLVGNEGAVHAWWFW
jgi:hypothetical protein